MGPDGGFYLLALNRLKELEGVNRKIIPFPRVFEKICSSFQVSKGFAWELLFLFSELGFVEIVPFHGIRIKKLPF